MSENRTTIVMQPGGRAEKYEDGPKGYYPVHRAEVDHDSGVLTIYRLASNTETRQPVAIFADGEWARVTVENP
jgi:hypothetical protein